jgi:hypothetical protein
MDMESRNMKKMKNRCFADGREHITKQTGRKERTRKNLCGMETAIYIASEQVKMRPYLTRKIIIVVDKKEIEFRTQNYT